MFLRRFFFLLFFPYFFVLSSESSLVQDLQTAPFLLDANAIAETSAHHFLSKMRSRNPALSESHLGICTHVFWWDDSTPLFEYSLQDANGELLGYIILSGSRELPPVMEYAIQGEVLSSLLTKQIGSYLSSSKRTSSFVKWYYFSPLELVAQVSFSDSSEVFYLAYPEQAMFRGEVLKIERNPRELWTEKEAEYGWDQLESADPLTSEPSIVLSYAQPVKYQQGCNQYQLDKCGRMETFDIADGGTYCFPHCIAGCVPVAWAMEASAFKRGDCFAGCATQIWPSSSCWSHDWSSTTNPNICQEVSDTIWLAHSYCSTSCEGGTTPDQLLAGQAIFPNVFGLNYRFYLKQDIDANGIQDTIGRAHQPFILTGVGQWNKYLAMHSARFQHSLASLSRGKSGHAILCYGCDNGGSYAYISMG